jgi:thiosulfate dehydrogenase [quinone] large subunit
MFLAAGWSKITTDWTAASYLSSANGPLADWFHSLAGSGFIDSVNAWGLFLLGVAILLGLLIRPASILGIVLMTLYYLAHFPQNTTNGLIDEHIILIAVLALFAAGGAGHAFGANAIVLGNLRKPNRVVKFLFG